MLHPKQLVNGEVKWRITSTKNYKFVWLQVSRIIQTNLLNPTKHAFLEVKGPAAEALAMKSGHGIRRAREARGARGSLQCCGVRGIPGQRIKPQTFEPLK